MVKVVPVSLNRQMIYCLIPFLDLYAAYKVKKLRLYLLIVIPIGIALSLLLGDDLTTHSFLIEIAVSIGLALYLIRRWSIKWNTAF